MKAPTNMIAGHASVSPGSLYQYYQSKEVIAHAYAKAATIGLHQVYDAELLPEVIALPLHAVLDSFIDALIAFNHEYPGYLALSIASTISPPLALALGDLRQSIQARLEALFVARWREMIPDQRRIRGLVSYRLFLALLPLVLGQAGEDEQAIITEMKRILYRYWEPDTAVRQDLDIATFGTLPVVEER